MKKDRFFILDNKQNSCGKFTNILVKRSFHNELPAFSTFLLYENIIITEKKVCCTTFLFHSLTKKVIIKIGLENIDN